MKMVEVPFMPVAEKIVERLDTLCREPKCMSCAALTSCAYGQKQTTDLGLKIPAKFNGIVILQEREIGDEAYATLKYRLQCAGLHIEDCVVTTIGWDAVPNESEYETRESIANCCSSLVYRRLEKLRAAGMQTIIAIGYLAFYSLYYRRVKDGRMMSPANRDSSSPDPVERFRGFRIPDGLLGAYVCPTYGASLITEAAERSAAGIIFKEDILAAVATTLLPKPTQQDYESQLAYKQPLAATEDIINRVVAGPSDAMISVDYETTGLRPNAEGHDVVCLSFCFGEKAYAFMLDTPRARAAAVKLLTGPQKKIAANLKFEESWSRAKLGIEVRNWFWDTMLFAHVLDNRDGISSVKFQSFMHFGLVDYNSSLENKLDSGGVNLVNDVRSIHPHDLLKYCAMDSLMEYRIAMLQMRGRQ